jgi:hypothetical protein
MIVGAAGELPKPPAEPIKFLEDMDDTELADAVGPDIPDPFLNSDPGPSLGCLSG